jgi:hypothetical protein
MKIKCESAQGMGQQYPDTFEVAPIWKLQEVVEPGVYAKICVLNGDFQGERIWTEVTEVDGMKIKATLANDPAGFEMEHGDAVEYQMQHIYNVSTKDGEELA